MAQLEILSFCSLLFTEDVLSTDENYKTTTNEDIRNLIIAWRRHAELLWTVLQVERRRAEMAYPSCIELPSTIQSLVMRLGFISFWVDYDSGVFFGSSLKKYLIGRSDLFFKDKLSRTSLFTSLVVFSINYVYCVLYL